jgi:hypothetical protein
MRPLFFYSYSSGGAKTPVPLQPSQGTFPFTPQRGIAVPDRRIISPAK